ncbi:Dolichyl-diphosphooligosaccharide-protein glycosyltransferase subunit dad1 [Sarracenia purpurea var. burkii]
MKISMKPVRPCTAAPPPTTYVTFRRYTVNPPPPPPPPSTIHNKLATAAPPQRQWQSLSFDSAGGYSSHSAASTPARINKRWMEYQGSKNWEGLLDPLDDNLRSEIIRYGHFVDAAYRAFDFDPASPTYGRCRYPKSSLLHQSGFPETGYRLTKNLRATSGIQLPRWVEKAPSWVAAPSSWIGYVAVCQDKEEIARLGRRDVVVAYRGTATCLEWLENLRATLTGLPNADHESSVSGEPMVESGFLSLYTSGTEARPSLQSLVREEIKRLLQTYGDEPLSLTITGHSLGAALATLTAHDIKASFKHAPLVTVVSFGGPRVGNRSFRHHLEKQGTKVLRIVNSDDLITKVPGFVLNDDNDDYDTARNGYVEMASLSSWVQRRVEETQWAYAEVGRELRLSSRDSPYLAGINIATCHELKTYLHLVNGFGSSTRRFRAEF